MVGGSVWLALRPPLRSAVTGYTMASRVTGSAVGDRKGWP
jgi:hypothetical protein